MQKLLFGLFTILAFCVSASAQEAPKKLDEIAATAQCELYLSQMDSIIAQAGNDPASTIYVFVYEGKTARYKYAGGIQWLLPQRGLAKSQIASMKKYVKDVRGFDVERFVFVEAGLRENSTVEFWHVPIGANAPEPSPTLKTTKYRKGKPAGFCLGCCP